VNIEVLLKLGSLAGFVFGAKGAVEQLTTSCAAFHLKPSTLLID